MLPNLLAWTISSLSLENYKGVGSDDYSSARNIQIEDIHKLYRNISRHINTYNKQRSKHFKKKLKVNRNLYILKFHRYISKVIETSRQRLQKHSKHM